VSWPCANGQSGAYRAQLRHASQCLDDITPDYFLLPSLAYVI
jgi:hypothetical protein